MSSTKSWAQIAARQTPKKTPGKPSRSSRQSNMISLQPLLYQPLIPALAMLDIKCPRCQHKNHPIVLDNIADDEDRPSCAECDVCFPPTGLTITPDTNTRAAAARKDIPADTLGALPGVSYPTDDAVVESRSIEQLPPMEAIAASESDEVTPPIQKDRFPTPPEYINIYAGEHLVLPSSRMQPELESSDFPNVAFFHDLKQKSRAAVSAELFAGSAPDDISKDKHDFQAPIGSAARNVTSNQDRSPTVRPLHDWRQFFLRGEAAPSIFHNFEEDLAREHEATMREG
jgi:hypothetical protein